MEVGTPYFPYEQRKGTGTRWCVVDEDGVVQWRFREVSYVILTSDVIVGRQVHWHYPLTRRLVGLVGE